MVEIRSGWNSGFVYWRTRFQIAARRWSWQLISFVIILDSSLVLKKSIIWQGIVIKSYNVYYMFLRIAYIGVDEASADPVAQGAPKICCGFSFIKIIVVGSFLFS